MKKFMILLIVALMLTISGATLGQDGDTSAVRFAHAVPGAPNVDVYINGQPVLVDLEFGTASNYLNAPVGTHTLTIRAAGTNTDLWTQNIDVVADEPTTFLASSTSLNQFIAFSDDFAALEAGMTRLKVIHAVEDAPAVTVIADDQTVVDGMGYGEFIGGFDIPAGTYNVSVTSTDDDTAIVEATPVGLTSSTSHLVTVIGTAASPELLVMTTPTIGNDDSAAVRFVHAAADAPAVDVYAEDTLIAPNLAFGDATEHLGLLAGDYTVQLRTAGTTDALLEAPLTVTAGAAATVVAQGTADDLAVEVYADETSGISEETALVSLINALPGESSVTLELGDDTTIASEVAFGSISDVVSLEPTTQDAAAVITLDGVTGAIPLDEMTFYGGVYYNAVTVDGTAFSAPTVLFFSTALAQGLNSAPQADDALVVELPETEETAVEETTAEVSEATQPPAEVTQPPAAPTNPPAAPPAVVTEPPLPTARVILDPGVNLQLRQFPSTQALSLGLAPAGSVVQVQGRAGDLEANQEGTVTIPLPLQDPFGDPDFEWVDPVTELDAEDPTADLLPEETWVFITYDTPDGGEVDAWVLALYLNITEPDGDPLALRDLPTVPSNRAGEARATDMTPPSAREDLVTAQVVGLDTGANLNIRRAPDNNSEVLGRLPNGAVAEVQGINEEGDWIFIRYQNPDGGAFTGWVSTAFVTYEFNDVAMDVEELFERNALAVVDETALRGSVSGSASVSAPTPDPIRNAYVATVQLDPDANLNLRRTPDVQAEVLARIPDATQVVVTGRTEDAEWLQTSFEEVEGWIATEFVSVTFNGVLVTDLTAIPVVDLTVPETETPTPTP